jgi:hypothetical protein
MKPASTQPAAPIRRALLATALLALAAPPALPGRGAPDPGRPKPAAPADAGAFIPVPVEPAPWKTGRGAPPQPATFLRARAAAAGPNLASGTLALLPAAADAAAAGDTTADLLVCEFEFPNWRAAGWTVSGPAFGIGPSVGAIGRQRPVAGFLGRRFAGSHLGAGEAPRGSVASPAFTIRRPYVNLLVGAGGWPGRTCVNLLVDGQIVRTAAGDSISERLVWKTWDVSDFTGQSAVIQIVDASSEKWGHINVDQITQSAAPATAPAAAIPGVIAPGPGGGGVRAAPDIFISDFEFDRWDAAGWTVTGDAFGDGPVPGPRPGGQRSLAGYNGRRLVNSYYHGGDGRTGVLVSPEFTIGRPYVHLLIGGGAWEGKTCVNLVIGGKTVRTAAGPNTGLPGETERLDWVTWDVARFAGQKAVLEIKDTATGPWGHINVDDIKQSASPVPAN